MVARNLTALAMAGAMFCTLLLSSCVGAFIVQSGSDTVCKTRPEASVGPATFARMAGDGWNVQFFAENDLFPRERYGDAIVAVLPDRLEIVLHGRQTRSPLTFLYADLNTANLRVCVNTAGGGEVETSLENGYPVLRLGFNAEGTKFGLTLHAGAGDRGEDYRRYEFSRSSR